MAFADANRVALYVSKETVWGENPSSPTMNELRFLSESLGRAKETVKSNTLRSDRQRDISAEVGISTEGDVNFELSYSNYDLLFEALLESTFQVVNVGPIQLNADGAAKTFARLAGSFITDGVKVGMWIKTAAFTNAGNNGIFRVTAVVALTVTCAEAVGLVTETGTGDETLKGKMLRNGIVGTSLLIERRWTDITKFDYFTGLRVAGFDLNITAKEIITGSFKLMGKTNVPGSATIAGTSTPATINKPITASVNVGTVLKDQIALANFLKSISISVTNNPRRQDAVANKPPVGIGRGFFEPTGTLEMYFEDLTAYNDFINHTSFGLSFRCTDPDGNVMIFTLPHLKTTQGVPATPGANTDIMLPLQFDALRDSVTDSMMQIDTFAA